MSDHNQNELKPCPFCGCDMEQIGNFGTAWKHPRNSNCFLWSASVYIGQIKSWNKRAEISVPDGKEGSGEKEANPEPVNSPRQKARALVLTAEEIRHLAEFCGMVVAAPTDEEKEDERETPIVIAPWPVTGVRGDGNEMLPPHKHIAFLEEYPEEGCIPLGSKLDDAPSVGAVTSSDSGSGSPQTLPVDRRDKGSGAA